MRSAYLVGIYSIWNEHVTYQLSVYLFAFRCENLTTKSWNYSKCISKCTHDDEWEPLQADGKIKDSSSRWQDVHSVRKSVLKKRENSLSLSPTHTKHWVIFFFHLSFFILKWNDESKRYKIKSGRTPAACSTFMNSTGVSAAVKLPTGQTLGRFHRCFPSQKHDQPSPPLFASISALVWKIHKLK